MRDKREVVYFKQKTAYEMRISDWSSDVCSSDLAEKLVNDVVYQESLVESVNSNIRTISIVLLGVCALLSVIAIALINNTIRLAIYSQRFIIKKIGRASCRERVCQSVSLSVVSFSFK